MEEELFTEAASEGVQTLEEDSEDAEEGDIRSGTLLRKGEQFAAADLYPKEMEDEAPGEWVKSASESISGFVNDPAFLLPE